MKKLAAILGVTLLVCVISTQAWSEVVETTDGRFIRLNIDTTYSIFSEPPKPQTTEYVSAEPSDLIDDPEDWIDKKIKIEFRRMRKNVTSSKGFELSVSAEKIIQTGDNTFTMVGGPSFKGFNKGIASYLITRVWKECDEICNWVTIFGVYRGWQASYHNIAVHHLEFRQP